MSWVAAETDSLRLPDVRRRLKAIFIGSIGNLVEWYDFYAYTAFALYFANAFFPGSDPVLQQLNAAVVFAIGFVMRPIGGWLFGYLADHHGRRKALIVGMVVFGVTSALAGSAGSAQALIAGRALMGVGAALIFPATLAILTDVFREPRERAKAIGIWSASSGMVVSITR